MIFLKVRQLYCCFFRNLVWREYVILLLIDSVSLKVCARVCMWYCYRTVRAARLWRVGLLQ